MTSSSEGYKAGGVRRSWFSPDPTAPPTKSWGDSKYQNGGKFPAVKKDTKKMVVDEDVAPQGDDMVNDVVLALVDLPKRKKKTDVTSSSASGSDENSNSNNNIFHKFNSNSADT